MRFDQSLKAMAKFLDISSSHLSGIEYGEKRLADKHIQLAVEFFKGKASPEELENLRLAGEKSKDILDTSQLQPDAKGLVAAFARKLQEGVAPTEEVLSWLQRKE